MKSWQFQVPSLQEAPSEELIERLHKGGFGNWEGDDSGMVFYNDHFHGDQKILNAGPDDWVVLSLNGAKVYKTQHPTIEIQK